MPGSNDYMKSMLKAQFGELKPVKSGEKNPQNTFEDEYRWAMNHPKDRDAKAFLGLNWGDLDRDQALFIAEKIRQKGGVKMNPPRKKVRYRRLVPLTEPDLPF
jgi:hypothetical protein